MVVDVGDLAEYTRAWNMQHRGRMGVRSGLLRIQCIRILACVPLLCAGVWTPAAALEAGVAACDITPDVHQYDVPMAGYGARNGKPSTGVHDSISAKVLYLQDGDTRMALVTADLRSVTPQLKNQIIEKAAGSGLTRDNLLVCASHDHSGPSFYPEKFWQLQFGVSDPAIVDYMSTQIAQAIADAQKFLFEAQVGSAQAMVDGFTRNRRWEYDLDARKTAGESPQTNPRLWVMRVDDASGSPRAILVNFATHPTILGADNFEISAEWPGVLQRRLEAAYPDAVALFTNGAEGDQAPAGARGENDFARVQDFGSRLAEHAAKLVGSIRTRPGVDIAFHHRDAPLGEPSFSEAARNGQYAFMEPMAMEVLPRHAEIQILQIGDIALTGVPGEPICEVGRATEAALKDAGVPEPIVIGLANDYIGYILNAKEYAHGGYEVDQRSYYGPTLGKRIAESAAGAVSGESP